MYADGLGPRELCIRFPIDDHYTVVMAGQLLNNATHMTACVLQDHYLGHILSPFRGGITA
jgi:hypothetical protein